MNNKHEITQKMESEWWIITQDLMGMEAGAQIGMLDLASREANYL